MNLQAFENLELIPMLLKKIENMEERMSKLVPPITTKREVAKFLNVTDRTINNYIAQGLLKEQHHFYRKNGKILVFIEDAIAEFKKELNKGIVSEKVTI
ncbi:MAG: helix-turn-helix domain-containing protein [Sulfurimonas sp.]|uniref:helix-turn-helix domain-containing protein n=1 Tax=Sulfurimonas sp. TaxID=2022749 RepID=UPI00260E8531|nr:helix-turn-helix domain-containing protein [Sulfurimonas sp.]MDD5400244.1 helix-turn-helix domain-containing protein [Sulfurimonas sp.]